MFLYYDSIYPDELVRVFGSKNAFVSSNIHIMNKNEAKMCRKLMSKTGLTEKELRQHKKYRKILSNAQKTGQKRFRGKYQKQYDAIMKITTKVTKLAKEHPITQKLFIENLKKYDLYHAYRLKIQY